VYGWAEGDGPRGADMAEESLARRGRARLFDAVKLKGDLQRRAPIYDSPRMIHKPLISALHKSVRGRPDCARCLIWSG